MISKKVLTVTLALVVGLTLSLAPSRAQSAFKIGVFDAQRVTQDTAEGAKIQARLNALKEKKGGELKKLQEEVEKLQQEFVQTSTSATEEKRKDLGLRIQRKQDELESAQKAAQRELQIEVEAAQDGWQRRVIEAVNNYGKQNGFTIIVPADVALYYSEQIDVTKELVKIIDSQPAPAAAVPPAAPAPAPAKTPPPAPKK